MLVNTQRRKFLRHVTGAGFAAGAARFFTRSAESAVFPQRFLFVYTNAGRDSDSRTTGAGKDFVLGPGLAALEPMRNKILILDGLKIHPHTGEEHPSGKGALLTGRPAADKNWRSTGISFDRYLAGKLTAGASFYTGTYNGPGSGDAGGIPNTVSWNAAGVQNDAFAVGSAALIQKLFGGPAPAAPAAGPAPAAPTAPTAPTGPSPGDQNEVALYDFLMKDVERMKRFASREVVDRLELHAQALAQIRSGFVKATGTTGGGTVPGTPVSEPPAMLRTCMNPPSLADAPTETDKISLVIANAFACGRARIGVVRIGAEDPYHNYSHWKDGATYRDNLRRMDKEWAGYFANLLKYLDGFPEGSGTLLDNTLVVWGSECCGEFGVGMNTAPKLPGEQDASNGIHNTAYIPFVLAGSMGGRFRTGQRIVDMGRTNVDLYRTIAQQMGVTATDFGDSAFSMGPLTDILV